MADQDEAMDHDEDIMVMSTGVRLRLRAPSGMVVNDLLMEAAKSEPRAPMVHSENKEREEENPLDPDFKTEYSLWLATTGVRTFAALVVAGTSIEEPLPDGVEGPDSEDFQDFMGALGISVAPGKYQRYVQWVKYVACTEAADQSHLSILLMRRAGVREEDVGEAQTLFQGLAERSADNGASPESGDRPRHKVSRRDRRARARDRTA